MDRIKNVADFESDISLDRLNLDYWYEKAPVKIDLLTVDPDVLDKVTSTSFQKMTVNITPQCVCGESSGYMHVGDLCLKCGTPVVESLSSQRRIPVVWVSAPRDTVFIAPQFWWMVNYIVTQTRFDTLAWLSNPRYKASVEPPKFLSEINSLGTWKRDYKYLVDNLENLIVLMLNSQTLYSKRDKIRDLLELYRTRKQDILSKHVPIPNKSLFLIEDSSFSTKKTSLVVGVLKSLIINYRDSIENERDPGPSISRLISELAQVYDSNSKELLSGKRKAIRTGVFGTKAPCSFRTVMIPISGPHNYDDFVMPWIEGVINFRPYLISRLKKRRYKYFDICAKLDRALYQYDEEIYQMMSNIIEEAKARNGKGLCIAMNRNPTQHRSSILTVYAREIKKDPFDFSSEYSILMCASLNGDHDGDEHNMTIANDIATETELLKFELHHSALASTKPYAISKSLSLPSTVVINLAGFVYDDENINESTYVDPELLKSIAV